MADVTGFLLGATVPINYTNIVLNDGEIATSTAGLTFYYTVRLTSGAKTLMWSGTSASELSASVVDGQVQVTGKWQTYNQTPAYSAGESYSVDFWAADSVGDKHPIETFTIVFSEPQTTTFA